jgi:hypothetical protein
MVRNSDPLSEEFKVPEIDSSSTGHLDGNNNIIAPKSGYTLVTLPRIVTSYRDSVDGTRDRVTYQKLVMR